MSLVLVGLVRSASASAFALTLYPSVLIHFSRLTTPQADENHLFSQRSVRLFSILRDLSKEINLVRSAVCVTPSQSAAPRIPPACSPPPAQTHPTRLQPNCAGSTMARCKDFENDDRECARVPGKSLSQKLGPLRAESVPPLPHYRQKGEVVQRTVLRCVSRQSFYLASKFQLLYPASKFHLHHAGIACTQLIMAKSQSLTFGDCYSASTWPVKQEPVALRARSAERHRGASFLFSSLSSSSFSPSSALHAALSSHL